MSCGGGSGSSGTNTVVQNSQPPAQVMQAYQNLTNSAFSQAGQPLQQYAGPMVAGFTPQQTQAFGTIQNAQGMATPYINAASQEFGQATTPFNQTVGSYESPYTGAVTNSLQGLFNQQNAQQMAQMQGNATSAGAYGGDREGVAQALTAQQQNLSEAPTLANVEQGGYQTALGAAEAQGWLGEQGAFGLGNLGTEAQNSALTGASAELQAGGAQQQLAQEQLNIPYEQFQSAQAYPWQVLGQLSPIVSGIGSASGGTGSTSYPSPSMVSQLGGLGIAGLGTYGLLNSTGALSGLEGLFGGGGAAASLLLPGSDAALAGGFAGAAGGISGAIDALGPLAAAAKSGGRVGFQNGGGIGGSSDGSGAAASSVTPGTQPSTLPTVPAINLDYLAHPGPAVKGAGPPRPPQGSPDQYQGMSPTQELEMFSGLNKMASQSGIGSGSAFGGRVGLQDGGEAPLNAAQTTGAALGGLPPNMQGYVQQLQNMPMDQLQAMSVRMPPSSPYGQIVQRVLNARRMTPSATPNQVSSASGVPIGTGIGQVPGIGGQQQAPLGATATQGQNQGGNPQQQGYAAGGGPVIEDEPDMDAHPIVDHSGNTVKIRYPSEGKVLDLGIPSMPGRRALAAGGASGPTVIGSGASNAQPFFSSLPSANGIGVPQLSMDAFAAPGGPGAMTPTAGGGLGNWFNPMPQYQPPGFTGNSWPSITPSTPGISALEGTFAPTPAPAPAGTPAPSSAASASSPSGGLVISDVPLTPYNTPYDMQSNYALMQSNAGTAGGGKRGGRMRLQDGGDAGVPGVVIDPDSPLVTGAAPTDAGPPPASEAGGGGSGMRSGLEPPPASASETDLYGPSIGSGGIGASPSRPPAPQAALPSAADTGVDPAVQNYLLTHVAPGESRGNPYALYGGGTFSDTSEHPADAGWKGGIAPDGQRTHAAGLLQDQPDTWHRIQLATGVPDFSPASQIKGNAWLAQSTYHAATGRDLGADLRAGKVTQVDQVLSSQWPSLAKGTPRPSGPGGIGTPSPGGGIGEPAPAPMMQLTDQAAPGSGGGSDFARALDRISSESAQAPSGNYGASPWMIPIAIGAGMMSGRSPQALVNVGQGLTAGVKEAAEQAQQIPENQLRGAQARAATIRNELLPYQMEALSGAAGSGSPMGAGAGQAQPAGAPAVIAPGAAVVSGPTGLPTPANLGLDPKFAQLDGQYKTIGSEIDQLQRLIPLYPDKAPELTATLASQMDNYTKLMLGDPRMQAQAEALKGWASVAPAGAKAGAEKAAQLPYTPWSVYPGGLHGVGNQVQVAAPVVRNVTNPTTGQPSEQYVTPPLPVIQGVGNGATGAPNATGTPASATPAATPPGAASPPAGGPVGEAWPTGLSPIVKEQIGIEQKGFEKAKEDFASAQNVQQRLGMMDHAIDTLNQSGWSSTGSGANMRIAAAKNINSFFTSLGGKPLFDPNKVASWEDLNKETTRAGFELARSLGSREAMMIVQSATAAVPNAQNTAMGAKLVSSSLNEAAQRQVDYYQYLNKWGQQNGGRLNGSDIAFNQQHPVQGYVNAAIVKALPQPALGALRNDPSLAQQFDAKYGPGLSDFVLHGQP